MEKHEKGSAFENILCRRTEAALLRRQEAFLKEHAQDPDEALLQYLRCCAKELGHSPNMEEVIGGELLVRRFGSWEKALAGASLGRPGPTPADRHRRIYREEKKHQLDLWHQEKQQKEVEKLLKIQEKEGSGAEKSKESRKI